MSLHRDVQKKANAAIKKVEKSGRYDENVVKSIKSAQTLDEIKQLVSFIMTLAKCYYNEAIRLKMIT